MGKIKPFIKLKGHIEIRVAPAMWRIEAYPTEGT
jgi:hypothetical protein